MDGTSLFLLTHTVCCYPSLYEIYTRPYTKIAAPISTHFSLVARLQIPADLSSPILSISQDSLVKRWADKLEKGVQAIKENREFWKPDMWAEDGDASFGLDKALRDGSQGAGDIPTSIPSTSNTISITIPDITLCSPKYTIVSHLFHHVDLDHYLQNAYTLWTSSIAMGLGFVDNWGLFVGGGMCGLVGIMGEQTWRMNLARRSMDKWRLLLPSNRYIALCGSSGGACGLVGCESWMLFSDLFKVTRDILRQKHKERESSRGERRERYKDFWRIVFFSGMRLAWIYAQVKGMHTSEMEDSSLAPLLNNPIGAKLQPPQVGYAAHVGGFVFGFLYGIVRQLHF
jgi:membrane associated rhomboid family serine protease